MNSMISFSEIEEAVRFISENGIKILNLCHIPEDGRLKTLSFSVVDKSRVFEILEYGERVDGSNLFSFIEAGESDIYITPNISGAFMNPFSAIPTLNVFCDYLDEHGKPLDVAPRNVLARAEEQLRSSSGLVLKALAELEFYVISKLESEMLFPGVPDKNYHESTPFARFEGLRNDVLATLADVGIATKYGHSEVGLVFSKNSVLMEQQEVEFIPQDLAKTAENIAIAKWIIRNVAVKYGASVSFSPKVSLEHAGTGMHIHLCAVKDGKNVVANPKRSLSTDALKMIGGILKFASSLSAFGNTTPVSYLRFIARKESPMHVCWSARNRLALIRIPLWWNYARKSGEKDSLRETFEYRAPDPFANAFLLFGGLALAVNYGLENSEESLETAKDLYVGEGGSKRKQSKVLPRSCYEAANMLRKDRQFYEANDVFPKKLIEKSIEKLNAFKDRDLWKNLGDKPEKVENVLKQYLHYG
ncbi:glutamine synthetase [Candidatus Bathyarchaeota archaeon]|nr:glutamine synthetase [Candidatus Bathyarchaeota archaeon]